MLSERQINDDLVEVLPRFAEGLDQLAADARAQGDLEAYAYYSGAAIESREEARLRAQNR